MTSSVSITVAIPTYGRDQVLVDTIRHVLALDPPPAEVIVLDQTKEHVSEVVRTLVEAWHLSAAIRWIRHQLRKDTHSDKACGAAVAAVMGKARILNLVVDQHALVTAQDFSTANSMHEIGKRLLQSIGFSEPDDASIAAAIEANDAFVERLEAIRAAAQGTIDQDDDD